MNHRSQIMVFAPLLIISLVICTFASAAPTSAEYGTVLNLSGKQRMLSQKMSKEILLIAYGHNTEANLKSLEKTSNLFHRTLAGLLDGDTELGLPVTENPRIRRQLGKVESKWKPFKGIVDQVLETASVSREQIATVAELSLPLLKEMNKAVVLYERDASAGELADNPALATAINLSGKQRMLTQKMSKEFMLVALNHDSDTNRLNLLETASLFDRTLKGLQVGDTDLQLEPTKDETILIQLREVGTLWANFKPFVDQASQASAQVPEAQSVAEIASANIPLLKAMNKAVGMYEKLAQ